MSLFPPFSPCHAGGILEFLRIAAMADTYYCKVAPHNPLGPIALAVRVQLGACLPNFLIAEHFGMKERWDLGEGYLNKAFEIVDGYVPVPQSPGQGSRLTRRWYASVRTPGIGILRDCMPTMTEPSKTCKLKGTSFSGGQRRLQEETD